MNRMIGSINSKFGKALVLCALALTLLGGASLAIDSHASGGSERLKSHSGALSLTAIDLASRAFARGQASRKPSEVEAWQMMSESEATPLIQGYLLDDGAFTIINDPGSILGSASLGINNRSEIVGFNVDNLPNANGFVLVKGVFSRFKFPGAISTEISGINCRSQFVGVYVDRFNTPHGFLMDNGNLSTIDFPDSFATSAVRINARGQIVGGYSDVSNARPITPLRGFLLQDGVFTKIKAPDATETLPQGINDRGQIVGAYVDATGTIHGFLLDKGVFTTIDPPATAIPGIVRGFASGARLGSAAFGINNRGQIVGFYADTGGRIHGYLLDKGVYTTIDAPGAINTAASDAKSYVETLVQTRGASGWRLSCVLFASQGNQPEITDWKCTYSCE